jgi:hypothetical protein
MEYFALEEHQFQPFQKNYYLQLPAANHINRIPDDPVPTRGQEVTRFLQCSLETVADLSSL